MNSDLRSALWAFAGKINWGVERLCALLIAVLVLDIWFGIIARYVLELGITWTEELARYIMIWAALLAVSSGAHRREHIGLDFIGRRVPDRVRDVLQTGIDCLGIGFFLFLGFYGVTMTVDGANQFSMIFGMTMVVPYMAVPVAAFLAALQIFLTQFRPRHVDDDPFQDIEKQIEAHGG